VQVVVDERAGDERDQTARERDRRCRRSDQRAPERRGERDEGDDHTRRPDEAGFDEQLHRRRVRVARHVGLGRASLGVCSREAKQAVARPRSVDEGVEAHAPVRDPLRR
jgi:hypothetical protein